MLEDFLSGKIGITFRNENENVIKQISDVLKSKYKIKRSPFSDASWSLAQQYGLYKRCGMRDWICSVYTSYGSLVWEDRHPMSNRKPVYQVSELLSLLEISIDTNDVMNLLNE